jgi:hypothetical protein
MEENKEMIEDKYKLFVEKTAASKLVWGLHDKKGWANTHAHDDEEIALIPFWSDRAFAKACAKDDWRGYAPASIPLTDFLENWCIEMADNDILVGIDWDANMIGGEINTLTVALDILNRLAAMQSAITFVNYGSIAEFITEINDLADEN